MGRKKSRNTAKTGDKKLYKSRDNKAVNESRHGSDDDDNMYNEVDRFHNRREEEDMIRFDKDGDDSESEDDGITTGREAVFDLGVGGSSSSEEDDSDEDSIDDDGDDDGSSPADEDDVSSSSDDDDSVEEFEDPTKTNVLDWGNKKREYYLGDTADLEIGQDEEDAEVEEEAGREIVRARLEKMDEDDFMLEDDDDDDDMHELKGKSSDKTEIETFQSSRSKESLQKLSRKEKLKLLHFSHPELLPIIEHFRDSSILKLLQETDIAADVLTKDKENAQAVGATPDGLNFLLTKAMLQTSTALNVCQYLLLKAEQVSSKSKQDSKDDDDMDETYDVKNHPVINRLNQFNDLAERLNDRVEKKIPALDTQIQNLVKAAALMQGGQLKDSNQEEEDDDEETASSDPAMDSSDDDSNIDEADIQKLMKKPTMGKQPLSSNDDNDDSSSEEDEEAISRQVMNEARFSYRPKEDSERSKSRRRRRVPVASDLGDVEEDDEATKAAGRSLEVKLNTISQKSGSKSKKVSAAPEDQDDADDEKIRRALEMMEDEYGAGSDEASGGNDDDDDDIEMDDDLNDNEFYSKIKQKSLAKKEFKKKLYAVAPKYPSFEGEVEGERSIGRNIMRNRGLVAHKNKLNRNPRVKKREQYRKALIRRKGAIRDVRTDEAHKYGGEETGIKSGLSRSRKLGSR